MQIDADEYRHILVVGNDTTYGNQYVHVRIGQKSTAYSVSSKVAWITLPSFYDGPVKVRVQNASFDPDYRVTHQFDATERYTILRAVNDVSNQHSKMPMSTNPHTLGELKRVSTPSVLKHKLKLWYEEDKNKMLDRLSGMLGASDTKFRESRYVEIMKHYGVTITPRSLDDIEKELDAELAAEIWKED